MSINREARGEFFKRRSFCIVTGASRGLGKEIAIQLSREWDKEGIAAICVYHDSRGCRSTKFYIQTLLLVLGGWLFSSADACWIAVHDVIP